MKAIVAGYGPTSIIVNPNHKDFSYLKGKWNQPCINDGNRATHSVLAVGWDEQYIILKNSYGKSWGVDGYMYVNRKYAKGCWLFYAAGVPFFK